MAFSARSEEPPEGIPRGYKIIEGDIIVPDAPTESTYASNLWPNGIVPYEFDPAVTPVNQSRSLAAMAEWVACANVLFIPRTTETSYVYIQNSNQNSSSVGRVGGKQILNMFNWSYKYIIAHELGHALGLWHEQSRIDRDTYVQINYENIEPGKEHNFNIHVTSGNFGPYDFDSVMHYGQYDFSTNGNPTITVLSPYEIWQNLIGQRSHLSVGDCDGMAFLYNSPTIHVPADQPTIQAAIDAAPSGFNNEIIVAPGTYNEVINFNGKAVTVRSTDPIDPAVVAATIIDGTGLADSVVKCVSGEGIDTILDGFTITGGNTTNGGGMQNLNADPKVMNCTFTVNNAASGGGMHNTNANPTVTQCAFDNNNATTGAGIYNDASSPTITNVDFTSNAATTTGGGMYNTNSNPTLAAVSFTTNSAADGAGMANVNSNPFLNTCPFSNNTATANGGAMLNDDSDPNLLTCDITGNAAVDGAGIYNTNASNPTLTQCKIIANTATNNAGAMLNLAGSPILINCILNGNTAANDAGAMLNDNASPTITQTVFSGNSAANGGAVTNKTGGTPTWINCTFSKNTAAFAGGAMHNTAANPAMTNSIFWDNTDAGGHNESAQIHVAGGAPVVNHCDVQGGWTATPGFNNINTDPLFNNPLGPDTTVGTADDDVHIYAGSQCANAGDNSVVTELTDFDGNTRIFNSIVDLGPFESFTVPADRDHDGDVDGVDFSVFASCYNKAGNPPRTLGCDIDDQVVFDADADNDIDGIDFSIFAACFNGAGKPPRTAAGGQFQCQQN
jgi:hypothetical protein